MSTQQSFSFQLPPPPPHTTSDPALAKWAEEAFRSIVLQLSSFGVLQLVMLHVEPDKPRDGMIVYADGTDWNPGSGEGVYARENGAWAKL